MGSETTVTLSRTTRATLRRVQAQIQSDSPDRHVKASDAIRALLAHWGEASPYPAAATARAHRAGSGGAAT